MSTQATRGNVVPACQEASRSGPGRGGGGDGSAHGRPGGDLRHAPDPVGVRIGLWESLAAGPISPGELAARSSASEPYIREWLRSQAAAGDAVHEPAHRTLPPAGGWRR